MTQKFLLLLLMIFPMSVKAQEGKGGFWMGGLYGKQSAERGGSIEPSTFGGTIGLKKQALGFGLTYFTGSETVTISRVAVEQKSSVIMGTVSWFPGGSKIFFIGPALGYAQFEVGASANGRTVTISSSGLLYGGSAGLNIPLGNTVSIGIDAAYLLGDAGGDASVLSYLGSLKIWL